MIYSTIFSATRQRFFVLDSFSLNNTIINIKENKPTAIEILPGLMPKIIKKILKQKCKQLENVSDWKQSSQSTI